MRVLSVNLLGALPRYLQFGLVNGDGDGEALGHALNRIVHGLAGEVRYLQGGDSLERVGRHFGILVAGDGHRRPFGNHTGHDAHCVRRHLNDAVSGDGEGGMRQHRGLTDRDFRLRGSG